MTTTTNDDDDDDDETFFSPSLLQLIFSNFFLPVQLLEAQARRVVVVDLVDGVLEDLPGFL